MKRRGFLGSLLALVIAPFVPGRNVTPLPLAFHPDAFKMVWPTIGDTIRVRLPQRYETGADDARRAIQKAMGILR